MMELDADPNVIRWSSEEVAIPYISPIDNRRHRYFPDFVVEMKENGEIVKIMVEIKPKHQTKPPSIQKKPTKKYINDVQTWGVNSAKWEAAEKYCDKNDMEFQILTEDNLNIKHFNFKKPRRKKFK